MLFRQKSHIWPEGLRRRTRRVASFKSDRGRRPIEPCELPDDVDSENVLEPLRVLQMQEPICPGEPAANAHLIVIVFDPHTQDCIFPRRPIAGVPQRNEKCRGASDQRPGFFS